ncbi:MAG: replication-associated recombination protein A, partial [Steroidobacteraceae bacterium]
MHLRDGHYKGAKKLGHAQGYVYPHDLPSGVAAQQYAPDSIHGKRYYDPSRHGIEERYADRVEKIRAMLNPNQATSTAATSDGANAAEPSKATNATRADGVPSRSEAEQPTPETSAKPASAVGESD